MCKSPIYKIVMTKDKTLHTYYRLHNTPMYVHMNFKLSKQVVLIMLTKIQVIEKKRKTFLAFMLINQFL